MPIRRESGLTDWTQDAPDPLYETILRRLREKNYNAALASPLDRIPRVQDFGAEPGGMHGWIEGPEEETMRRMALGERYHSRIGEGGILEGNYPEAITPGESRRGGFEYETARLPDFREELPAYLQDATDAQARIDAASVVNPLENAPLGGEIGNYRTGYPVDAGTPDINQGNDMWWAGAPGYDTEGVSVVPRPTIPTEKQIIDSTVTAPEDERDAAFSRIHNMWARESGGDYGGYESEWAEGLGVPAEYIDFYMQVPLEAKMFAHENKGDAKIQSDFEEKYGFVLDVDVPLQGGMERSDLLNLRSTGIPTAP